MRSVLLAIRATRLRGERNRIGTAVIGFRGRQPKRNLPWPQPALVVAALLIAATIGLHALLLPAHLVLPALSGTLTVAAFAVAALAWRRPAAVSSGRISYWDYSGALYFLGCGAAILGEADFVAALMEEIKVRR
jgi:hypothetical protein